MPVPGIGARTILIAGLVLMAAVAAPLPVAAPVTIVIPSLGVTAPVACLDLNVGGTVQVPPLGNHNLAGWYDRAVTPGARGTSVTFGHVDDYAGPSVVYNLKNLRPGDAIHVTRADGTTAVFAVDGVQKGCQGHRREVTRLSRAAADRARAPAKILIIWFY